jgi:5-oxoprolinase (ATP-hydrolysing)
LWIDGAWCDIEAHERSDLQPGQALRGPMLVSDPGATIWIARGWSGALDRSGSLVLERGVESTTVRPDPSIESNPQRLEVFNGIYMHAAEQMGAVLRQTASSVNIKERLDFSCAIFDARSRARRERAAHACAPGLDGRQRRRGRRAVWRRSSPGDAYLLNSPYEGGTHLPDLTVVTPVFDAAGSALIAFVASRAHHADIGGVTPGSMPPWSRSIDDEGVLIEPLRILRDGVLDEAGLRARFRDNPHPARDPDRNVADLRAQARSECLRSARARTRRGRTRSGRARRLHVARPGQRGAVHAPRDPRAARRRIPLPARQRPGHRGANLGRTRARAMQPSISRARRRSSTTT